MYALGSGIGWTLAIVDPAVAEGKLFISFTGDADSTLSSEKIRGMMLDEAIAIYNEQHKNNRITLSEAQKAEFRATNMMGVAFQDLPEVLLTHYKRRHNHGI